MATLEEHVIKISHVSDTRDLEKIRAEARKAAQEIERAFAVAAGADDIHRALGGVDRIAFGAHHCGGGGIFIYGFAACAQGHQQAGDLGRCRIPLKEHGKGGFSLSAGQWAISGGADQRF